MGGKADANGHNHVTRGLRVDQAGYTRVEKYVLQIARHFMQSFAVPESQGWIRAFGAAHECYPDETAPNFAIAVFALLQNLRATRGSGFQFCNPDCARCAAHLSEDERRLMEVVIAVGQGKRSDAHAAALILCEGTAPDGLFAAADYLCCLIADHHRSRWGMRRPKPAF